VAIKNIIAQGIGFSPGSVKFIPTLGFSIGVGVVYRFTAGILKYVAANYSSLASFYFEVYHRARIGTVHAQLYDITTSAVVSGSQLSTTSTTRVRQRSEALALTDGHEYEAQFGTSGADRGYVKGGVVIDI
jgi:hypothetical protein